MKRKKSSHPSPRKSHLKRKRHPLKWACQPIRLSLRWTRMTCTAMVEKFVTTNLKARVSPNPRLNQFSSRPSQWNSQRLTTSPQFRKWTTRTANQRPNSLNLKLSQVTLWVTSIWFQIALRLQKDHKKKTTRKARKLKLRRVTTWTKTIMTRRYKRKMLFRFLSSLNKS